ncbi:MULTISPECIES: thrombospondin type-1 domain-containing protein [Flavobacterium]|uniref:Thrombospondin type-1 domain-containing protein n=1 Tax=Flavobacterium keumense TaxID=1306518 RepID=A0ABY8N294_9FLAO|nr:MULTISPECIES: thrombospondin type-1 domain-containing protein [Flavobacterium]WGK93789.1 thrombospondin type-1 domain-containing protein [Flavobacterium keumense]
MPITRRTYNQGRMQLDVDNRLLPDGEYREAYNAIVFNNESLEEGSVKKSYSNKKLTNLNIGTNPIYMGGYSHPSRNRVYWLVLSDSGCFLIEYDFTNNIATFVLKDTRPLSTRVFNLKADYFCTGIQILSTEGVNKELFLMTEDNMQPLCFNIERAKTWAENGFEKEDIYLIKKPPRYAPTTIPTFIDNAGNNLEEKFLSFSYRYKYLDGEYSALSSFSNYNFYPNSFKLDYGSLENVGMANYFNAIHVTINTGDKRVTDVQIIAKESNSNALYLVETFNKETQKWGDSQSKSFVFSNNKLYSALPERELYRSFDNVPIKAKALTLIGNIGVFGNFEEGFDLALADGNKFKLDYNLSLNSKNFEGNNLGYSIGTNQFQNDLLVIDFGSSKLKSGSEITLFINLENNQSPPISYNNTVSYLLTKDFKNATELAVDEDFVFFITQYMTNLFLSNYTITEIPNSDLDSNTTFTIHDATATSITIESISLNYTVSGGSNQIINWKFTNVSSVLFYEDGDVSTLKTNRSYEVGFVYMDEFNRSTTVLTQFKNTLFIPHELALSKNKIKVAISHKPPKFADRYKIVVKQKKLSYQAIYATTFYVDGLFRWIKLEGENKDKVKVGDTLIFKSDTNGFVENLTRVKVLEIETKEKEFIEGNVDLDGNIIKELPGIYMKIKTPAGISMDYIKEGIVTRIGAKASKGDSFDMYIGQFSNKVENAYVDIPIKQGSRIDIEITNKKYGSNGGSKEFIKTFYVSADYSNFQAWYNAEVNNNTGDFSFPTNGVVRGEDSVLGGFVNDPNGALYLRIHNELNGNGQHPSYLNATVTIRAANGVLIFETEEKKSDEQDIYFETEQTFDIINGLHQGNLQNQTSLLPAEIDLDFFNCYSMKNGVESYIVKDGFNKPYLNIDLRPSAVSIEEYKSVRRFADLTYSEPYVESSSINGLNVFNLSMANFKDDIDKQNGSIQLLHSRENDIVVLQENKSGKVLFNKQAIYTADGNSAITTGGGILGQYIPYAGNNGIGINPDSFSVDGNGRIKYASIRNGSIIRLSNDGIEEITYGLRNFFRDLFTNRTKGKIISGYDPFLDLTTFTIGENIVETPTYNCGTEIVKNKLQEPFSYILELNSFTGQLTLNYVISEGSATIEVVHDGVTSVMSGLSGSGNMVINRSNLNAEFANITITPVGGLVSFSIANNCPIGIPLEIVYVVLNDESDLNKTITNKFKAGSNTSIQNEDIFSAFPITKFERTFGYEGKNSFPKQNDLVTIESLKETTSTGEFLPLKQNRIGYVISTIDYTEATLNQLIQSANFLTLTETTQGVNQNTFAGNFVFSRSSNAQKLYLIWDYRDVNSTQISLCYDASNGATSCIACNPVNCVVSDWSDWSECSNGSQSRTRTVITPASNGGTACPVLSETRSCTTVVGQSINLNYDMADSQSACDFNPLT